MANLKGLKKTSSNRFGTPPATTETSDTLEAPEIAPAPKPKQAKKTTPKRKARAKTHRTSPWGTTVKEDFSKRFKLVAAMKGCKNAELLESWLEAEEKKLGIRQ